MRKYIRRALGAGAAIGLAVTIAPVTAHASNFGHGPFEGARDHAVFVQTNDPAGNQIVSYERRTNGQLSYAGRYDTGGLGIALTGAVVDKLASQGSLVYDRQADLLIAINGGSNSITTFDVNGAHLSDRRTVPSGGTTPVSVTAWGNALYVLNAGGAGSIQGLYADSLSPIPGSARSLNLTPDVSPQYLNTPGQIGLTPSGHQLVVTTKQNGSDIDVFGVSSNGALSTTATVNASATPVTFGFTFDPSGDLVVAEAGLSALTTYAVLPTGIVKELGSTTNGLAALCWVTSVGNEYYYGANAGSSTITGYTLGSTGTPTIVGETVTDPGPIDLAASPDGSSLYVETGQDGIVDGFAVNSDGSLSYIGSVAPELPGHSGLEGIAVS